MISHCGSSLPHEACGLLAGTGNTVSHVYEMTNSEPSPVSYLMDPAEQFTALKYMRRKGLRLLGIYHSHPQSQAYPSPKDVSLAFYDDAVYIIVSLIERDNPEVRAFTIVNGDVDRVDIDVLSEGPAGSQDSP